MIELPEARTISKDLRTVILGKQIIDVKGNFIDHKFTFYYGDPNSYKEMLLNKKVTNIIDRNYYVEIEIEDFVLTMRDGANIRYYEKDQPLPSKSKLQLVFQDGSYLNITTSMYSFLAVFSKKLGMDNPYYLKELTGVGALDPRFTLEFFKNLKKESDPKLSLKAFLGTNQRILGIGNGVLQDILFYAKLNPKRKINTLTEQELSTLYHAIIDTLTAMIQKGGRDIEKNIFNKSGGYSTILSKNTYQNGCPHCKGIIKKEQYLGGSIYYCPNCQI